MAKILYEIFGSIKKGREKSLIMSRNEEVFFKRYKRKSKKWDFKKNGKKNKITFKKWFDIYKLDDILNHVINVRNKFKKVINI